MGIKGDLGLPGDPGPVGPRGPPGAKGAKGEPAKSISTPSLLHRPVETTVNKSQTAILKRTADGNPSPQVTWSKMNSSLPVGRHVVESSGALILKNVRPGDEGVYRCRAENLLGSVNASVKLTVRCRLTCYFFLYSKVATGARTIRGAKGIAVKEKDLFGVFSVLLICHPCSLDWTNYSLINSQSIQSLLCSTSVKFYFECFWLFTGLTPYTQILKHEQFIWPYKPAKKVSAP